MGRSRSSPILLLLLIVIGAGALFLFKRQQHEQPPSVAPSPRPQTRLNLEQERRRVEQSVNRHIQVTNKKIENDKEVVRLDAGFKLPKVGVLIRQPVQSQSGVDLSVDKREMNPARDLERRPLEPAAPSAADVVQADLARLQHNAIAEEQFRREYAKAYIEEARRNGYEIKLDNDYRVIDIRPLSPSRGVLPTQAEGGGYR